MNDINKTPMSSVGPEQAGRQDLKNMSEPAGRSKAAAKAAAEPKDSIREIVETVVFVVVLVLLLKSFVAEAFVIPTGSMATTLLGYQKTVVCPQCTYSFPVNCSDEGEKNIKVLGCTCPNCRYEIDFEKERMNPSCDTGDRVLVDKDIYDTGLAKPERGDVLVFKYPEKPQTDYVPTNYIKRLQGLPGETIGIYFGKLYHLDPSRSPHYDDSDIPVTQHWELVNTKRDDPVSMRMLLEGKFTIFRKPPAKMLALRRIVYDNDHPAKDLKDVLDPRWAGEGKAWDPDEVHGFQHAAREKSEIDWLHYRHLLRGGNNKPELITDFVGYNTKAGSFGADYGNGTFHPILPPNWVGDLMLECEVTVERPSGELILELTKGVDRFQARWDLASGKCTLIRLNNGNESELDSKMTSLKKEGTYRLRFANIDERLAVWVDSALPFGDGIAYDAGPERGPAPGDLQPASIGVKEAALKVRKLKLWRDTYYTINPSYPDSSEVRRIMEEGESPAVKRQELHALLSDPERWARLRDLPAKTIYVWPGHYLCLGDNSPESSDGRSWGLVPERLLLGRALVVYYPFSRAGTIK